MIKFFHVDFLIFSLAFISSTFILSIYWVKFTVKCSIYLALWLLVLFKYVAPYSLTIFFLTYPSSLWTIWWYSIIVLYCKYFLASHIPISLSNNVFDVDFGSCSNFLSALLCIRSTSSISPRSITGIRHTSDSFSLTLITSSPTWPFVSIVFISHTIFFDFCPHLFYMVF